MAKKAKAKAKKATAVPPPEFGVPALAKHMGMEEATVRIKLRDSGFKRPKGERGYNFKTKAGLEAAAKKLGHGKTDVKAAA